MLYFFLITAWPLINYINLNLTKISDYRDVAIIGLGGFGFSALLFFLVKKVLKKNTDNFLLPFLVFILLFFNYALFIDKFGHYLSFGGIKASYIWAILVLLSVLLSFKVSNAIKNKNFIKIMIVTMLSIAGLDLGVGIWKKSNLHDNLGFGRQYADGTQENDNDLSFIFKSKPNIYYILVDAYARQDTLKELTGFDNECFLQKLEAKGFSVSREAHSNYHFTGASLSATMNLDYHKARSDKVIPYEQMHEALKGRNLVRKIFKENGYKIINIPAHWHQMSCYGHEDICLKEIDFEVYQSFFLQTPLRKIKFKNHYLNFNDIILGLNLFPDYPKFIFAHVAHVHDAIYGDSGEFLDQLHPIFSSRDDSGRYVSSIKIVNEKLFTLVEGLIEADPSAIIVIQADHGPTYVGNMTPPDPEYWIKNIDDLRLQKKEDIKYTFGIFSAIYIPKLNNRYLGLKEYFSGKYSSVNTFRAIFSYVSDDDARLLPDKVQFLYYAKSDLGYRKSKDFVNEEG